MKTLIRKTSMTILIASIAFLSSNTYVSAEDIEIYNNDSKIPNVFFIVDTSESMETMAGTKTRMQHVKDALSDVLGDSYDTLNVGIMNLGYYNGSGPDFPVKPINALARDIETQLPGDNDETVGQFITRLSGAYEEKGNTPTVDTYYEAMLYYRGTNVLQGKRRPGPWDDARNYYANSELGTKVAPEVGYPIPGPLPVSQTYHRDAANPLSYTGAPWDPDIELMGNSCWTIPTGSGTPPTGTQCVPANIFQEFPYTANCTQVNPVPETTTTYERCVRSEGGECAIYSESGTSTAANPFDECAEYTPRECVETEEVTTTIPARQGYYRCNHKKYGAFPGDLTYDSPINNACNENFIVMLTDGAPSINWYSNSAAQVIFEDSSVNESDCDDLSTEYGISNPAILDHGRCGPDIAKFMAEQDQSTALPGNQIVKTYTVGIQLSEGSDTRKYLEAISSNGQGAYIDAQNPATLVDELKALVASFSEKPKVISRFTTTPDLVNLGRTRPEVYMPLFTNVPDKPRWKGNLKGFLFDANGVLVDTTTPPTGDPKPVFVGGEFNASASSFWSSGDGGNVEEGGLAGLLPNPANRNLLTEDTSGTLIDLESGVAALNTNPTIFGDSALTEADIDELIDWVNGEDIYDEDGDPATTKRNYVGDALHSNPVVVRYGTGTSNVTRAVTFFMTNEGILHAIDDNFFVDKTDNTASEIFAYMPRDLLSNIKKLRDNTDGGDKIYGLDGPLVLYQEGGFRDLESAKKYLIFGMRRGGMNYYAIDVTNPDSPSLLWTINGGYGDFAELGQSWSTPIPTEVDVNGTITPALVFGGGYDTDQDSTTTWQADDQGRAIYVVNIETGEKIWSAGPTGASPAHNLELSMTNAVVADVSIIDFDNDNAVDRLYFGDVGGHIWRIDIEGDITDDSKTSGYMLAQLRGTTTANNRRFFSRPAAAFTKDGKLAISIGSGNRVHPLQGSDGADQVTDRFYTLFDPNPAKGDIPSSFTAVLDDDLQDLSGFTAGFDSSSSTSGGWRVDLQTNEKIFDAPRVLLGEIFFSTYVPPVNPCSNGEDGSNLYVLNLEGEPTRDLIVGNGITKDPYTTINNLFGFNPFTLNFGANGLGGYAGSNLLPRLGGVALDDLSWTNAP